MLHKRFVVYLYSFHTHILNAKASEIQSTNWQGLKRKKIPKGETMHAVWNYTCILDPYRLCSKYCDELCTVLNLGTFPYIFMRSCAEYSWLLCSKLKTRKQKRWIFNFRWPCRWKRKFAFLTNEHLWIQDQPLQLQCTFLYFMWRDVLLFHFYFHCSVLITIHYFIFNILYSFCYSMFIWVQVFKFQSSVHLPLWEGLLQGWM